MLELREEGVWWARIEKGDPSEPRWIRIGVMSKREAEEVLRRIQGPHRVPLIGGLGSSRT